MMQGTTSANLKSHISRYHLNEFQIIPKNESEKDASANIKGK